LYRTKGKSRSVSPDMPFRRVVMITGLPAQTDGAVQHCLLFSSTTMELNNFCLFLFLFLPFEVGDGGATCESASMWSFGKTVEVEVTLQLTNSQSVCQGVEPTLELVTRYYFLSEGCCLKDAVLSLCGALSDERSGLLLQTMTSDRPDLSSERAPQRCCLVSLRRPLWREVGSVTCHCL
jgi:hypothetical protein